MDLASSGRGTISSELRNWHLVVLRLADEMARLEIRAKQKSMVSSSTAISILCIGSREMKSYSHWRYCCTWCWSSFQLGLLASVESGVSRIFEPHGAQLRCSSTTIFHCRALTWTPLYSLRFHHGSLFRTFHGRYYQSGRQFCDATFERATSHKQARTDL